MLNNDQIKEILPHREPFLFIDRITHLEEGVKAIGEWFIRPDYFFFQGHFPDYPVVPGVIIVESIAQVGAVALLATIKETEKIVFFAGIEKMKFRRQVRPNDKLVLEMEILKVRSNFGKGQGKAFIDDQVVAEGIFSFALGKQEPI